MVRRSGDLPPSPLRIACGFRFTLAPDGIIVCHMKATGARRPKGTGAKSRMLHGIRGDVDSRRESNHNVEVRFATLQWLFPAVIILHNLEEALWLPGWANRTGFWRTPVSPRVFRFVVAVLTALALAVTWLSARSGAQTPWTYLMFGCMVATLANAVYPHLALSISRRSYMPGTATAVALNLPVLFIPGGISPL